jgi:hypothetical protein
MREEFPRMVRASSRQSVGEEVMSVSQIARYLNKSRGYIYSITKNDSTFPPGFSLHPKGRDIGNVRRWIHGFDPRWLMKRNRVLDRAKEVINGPREDSYGSPRDNHQRIADIWSAITGYKFTPEMVVMMMIGTKLARLATRQTTRTVGLISPAMPAWDGRLIMADFHQIDRCKRTIRIG